MEAGLFIIHAFVGLTLAAHGAQKLFGWFGGYGISGTAGYLEAFGFRNGRLMAVAAGGSEFAGGLLLAAGLATPLAAAVIASTMFVAAFTDHAGKGFWIYNGGKEFVLTVATVAIGLALNGAGAWSLDAAIGLDVAGVAWGLGAAGVAVAGAAFTLGVMRRPPIAVPHPTAA